MRLRVLFVSDSTSNPNWGDRAAAISLREMVTAAGGEIVHSISEQELFRTSFGSERSESDEDDAGLLTWAIKQTLPPGVLSIRRRLTPYYGSSRTQRFIPTEWKHFETCSDSVLTRRVWPRLLDVIPEIDVAVIHGDGAMVGSGVHPRTLLFLTYLVKERFGKPVVLVNHTADLDNPSLREMAQNIYPLYDDVVFRDPISLERCRAVCGGRFAADTAFWFKAAPAAVWKPFARRLTYFDVWPDEARFDPSRPYLCIGGSSIFREAKPSFITEGYVALTEHLRSVYSGQLILAVSDSIENAIFRPLAERLKLPLLSLKTPVQQAVDVLGNADAYIGGRWHAAIFALAGGTPVVPLTAKTFKMQALARMAELSSPTFDALSLATDRESIGRQLVCYLEDGANLRNRLRSWAESAAEQSWENVSYLRTLAARTTTPVTIAPN